MRNILTENHKGLAVMRIPALQKDVVRFKLTVDLVHKDLFQHPSLLPQLSELLLSGTKSYSRDALTRAFEQHGAEVSVSHDDISLLTFNVTTLRTKLDKVLVILESILTESTFPAKEITRVKKQIVQELIEERDDADARAYARFTEIVYGKNSPNTVASIERRKKDLEATTQKYLRDMYALLKSRTWLVSLVCDNSSQEKILKTLLGVHKNTVPHENAAAYTVADSAHEYISVPSKANVELVIGNCLPIKRSSPEYAAFFFGLSVLAKNGGFSGRLMSIVREKEGLTYGIYGKTRGITVHKSGSWFIDTFFTPKDLQQGLTSTKREIARIVKDGITNAELTRFKTLLNNQYLIVHESDTRTLNHYHGALIAGLTAESERAFQERLLTLTKREVDAVLRAYLEPERLVIVGAGPVDVQGRG